MDFPDVPEEQNPSDIDSEKDVFNDETFGVAVDDVEGNEFDFTAGNTEVLVTSGPNVNNFPVQNIVTKHADRQMAFQPRDDSADSDDVNESSYNPAPRGDENFNQHYRADDGYDRGQRQVDRRFDQFGQTRQPQYFRQQEDFHQRQPQQQQQPFQVSFNALSLAGNESSGNNRGYGDDSQSFQQQQYHRQNQNHNQNRNQDVSFQPFSFAQNGYRRPQWDDDNDDSQNYQRQNFQQRGYYQNNGQPQFFRNRQQQGYQQQGYQQQGYQQQGFQQQGFQQQGFQQQGYQQQGFQQNWQQREYHSGGGNGGYQRNYQRHDDDRYDDRNHGGRWQHREHRQFERRGPYDPWAGLMTWREKLTVLRIQLLQIISDRGANLDDYYARMIAEKRREATLRAEKLSPNVAVASTAVASASGNQANPASVSGNDSSDNEDGNRLNGENRRHGFDRRRTVSASLSGDGNNTNNNTRNRIPIPRLSVVDVQPYKPLAYQGTLGKWTTTTVTRPRQIIDCSAMQNLEDLEDTTGKPRNESTAKLLRQALGSVERLYDFVLLAEELERLLKQGPITSTPDVVPEGNGEGALRVGSFQSTNMPKPVDPAELENQLLNCRQNIALTLCAPTRLALVLAIRKGRKIMPRALKALDRGRFYTVNFELSLHLATVLCEHLPLLIRRETNAVALIAVVTPLCSFVKGVILGRNTMPAPGTSDDFLFTVRHILADKALGTRSPELVTLLGTLVNVRK